MEDRQNDAVPKGMSLKNSRLWLMLILTAFGLLLSAANKSVALKDERHNQKHNARPGKQQTSAQNQQTILVPSPGYQAALLEALRAIVSEEVARQKQEHADYRDWSTPSFWLGNVGLLIVGGLYTFAAWRQLRATRVATEATVLALNASRPYIWVRKIEGEKGPPNPQLPELTDTIISANCFIQNLGKGPAFIVEVRATLKFSYPPLALPANFSDCGKVHVLQPVVTEAGPTNFFVPSRGGNTTASGTNDPNARERFVCYGIISYRDVHGNRYESGFGYHRQWLTSGDPDKFRWIFVRGPDEYNRERKVDEQNAGLSDPE